MVNETSKPNNNELIRQSIQNCDTLPSSLHQHRTGRVRNIINIQHKSTREPLNLFFVDIEPAPNNRNVYDITGLQNRIVKIEPPHSNKTNIIQCTRCQQYGHTKSYCNKPYVCVKCGGSHKTTDCKKTRDTPARCAHCGGDHPANYRGCEHYRKLTKGFPSPIQQKITTTPIYSTESYARNIPALEPSSPRSYADATRRNPAPPEESTHILIKFLDEFKNLLQQLLQQNTMVLNMITTLVNKMH